MTEANLEDLKRRLCDGLQVLTKEQVLDGGGHLSVRVPGSNTFLINPRFAGVLADPDDICTVAADAKRIAGAGPVPSESVIHAAVYASRPEVNSVLHCHPRYAILVGALEQGLIPFNRQARIFTGGVSVYPSSKGIRTWEQASEMADALGERWATFLRGHGVVVCGPGIEGTCISAISLERSCEDQLLLMSFTTPKPLEDRGPGRSQQRMENPYRAWPYYLYKNGVRSSIRPPAEGVHYS